MPNVLNTNLQTVLPALRDQLVNQRIFDSSRCYLGLYAQHLDPETADVFCVITPGRQVADQGALTGAGNYLLFFDGEVEISLWCRLVTDAGDRADDYLTNPDNGLLPTLETVYQTLNMFQPLDGNGNQIIAEPFRILSIDKFQRATDVPGWGFVKTNWRLTWTAIIPPQSPLNPGT